MGTNGLSNPNNQEDNMQTNDEYEMLPEEIAYQNYSENDDTPFVHDAVQIRTEVWTVSKLFRFVDEGRIQSLSPYLQRILLTKVWRAENYAKAKSYVRDMWMGIAISTPFFLVPLELVLENIEQAESNTTDKDIKHQIDEVKTKILEFRQDKVAYINLDGQTRSKESIVPYLKSQFTLSSEDNASSLMIKNKDGNLVDISQKTFIELDAVQRGYFYSIPLLVNTMLNGSLDSITGALISINSNEKWTEWQEIYNGTWISVYPKRINEVYELEESGLVKDFFLNKLSHQKYKPEVSGWEQFIAEQLFFLKNFYYPDMEDIRSAFRQNGTEVPSSIHASRLRKYIVEYADNYTSDTKITPQMLSDWIMFRDVLENGGTVKNNSYYMNFSLHNIELMKVISIPKLLTWFSTKLNDLTAEYIIDENGIEVINSKTYIHDGKTLVARDDSYESHKKGGYKLASIIGRMKILINEFNIDYEELRKKAVVTEAKSMPSRGKVFAANNHKSNAGILIDPTKKSSEKYERGHVQSRKNGGEDVVTNLKPQVKEANRAYSGRNMITKKGKK
jgi:hypothetical protein